jgi:hypothetical protein
MAPPVELIREVGITVGDHMKPSTDAYTYLGQHFDHGGVTVAPKAYAKYNRALELLKTGDMVGADAVAIFSHCIWGATVTNDDLCNHYYIFKYIRRLSTHIEMEKPYQVWPCILDEWQKLGEEDPNDNVQVHRKSK